MNRQSSFAVRIAIGLIVGPALVLAAGWLAVRVVHGIARTGQLGAVGRQLESTAPAIEQRNREVQELTKDSGTVQP